MTAIIASPRGRRRSAIPWLFPAAMLPVVAANGALIYLAVESKPVLVAEHPFEDGRIYNRELAAAAKQAARGWTASLEPPRTSGTPTVVIVDICDRDNVPVTGLQVKLRLWRPVGTESDLRLYLSEASAGRYAAQVTLPLPGQWQLDLVATRGEDEFVLGQRIIVR